MRPLGRSALLAPAAVTALALGGCAIGDDGPRTTQTRDVAAFTRIDSRGSADVRLHVGARQSVRVRAGEKVIDDVDTEVSGGTLRIEFDHHGFGGNDVVVDAAVPRLTAVATSGSGDADVRAGSRLDIDVDGSGDVTYHGRPAVSQRVDGSGEVSRAG